MDNETPKTVTGSKLVITVILFIGLGLILNSLLTSNQVTGTHTTIEGRAEVGNEILKLTKDQTEQIKILSNSVANVETKLENLEKTGKSIK